MPVDCPACGAHWSAPSGMAGFRFKCSCAAMVSVPLPRADLVAQAGASRSLAAPAAQAEHPALAATPVWTPAPALSQVAAPGELERAHPVERARWTNRALLEFVVLMTAILAPHAVAYAASEGEEQAYLSPFASLLSAVLVIVLAAGFGSFGLAGFRKARLRHWLEGGAVALLGLGFAHGWVGILESILPDLAGDDTQVLVDAIGLPATLFVVSAVPAFVEELAFRGVLQGRLCALFGLRLGVLLASTMFALCHLAPMVLPIHFGLGLYLGWLRQRCGSLLPCMATHALYNALVVVSEI